MVNANNNDIISSIQSSHNHSQSDRIAPAGSNGPAASRSGPGSAAGFGGRLRPALSNPSLSRPSGGGIAAAVGTRLDRINRGDVGLNGNEE